LFFRAKRSKLLLCLAGRHPPSPQHPCRSARDPEPRAPFRARVLFLGGTSRYLNDFKPPRRTAGDKNLPQSPICKASRASPAASLPLLQRRDLRLVTVGDCTMRGDDPQLTARRMRLCRVTEMGQRDGDAALIPHRNLPKVCRHHSITWLARRSSEGETSRPSILAVLRLITNSYRIGCSIGRSAGRVPRNTLSA
jgi:hypothetical protein